MIIKNTLDNNIILDIEGKGIVLIEPRGRVFIEPTEKNLETIKNVKGLEYKLPTQPVEEKPATNVSAPAENKPRGRGRYARRG